MFVALFDEADDDDEISVAEGARGFWDMLIPDSAKRKRDVSGNADELLGRGVGDGIDASCDAWMSNIVDSVIIDVVVIAVVVIAVVVIDVVVVVVENNSLTTECVARARVIHTMALSVRYTRSLRSLRFAFDTADH